MAITPINLKDSYIKSDSAKVLNRNQDVTNVLADTLAGVSSNIPSVQSESSTGYSNAEFWGVVGGVVTVMAIGAGLIFRKQLKNAKLLKKELKLTQEKLKCTAAYEEEYYKKYIDTHNKVYGLEQKVQTLENKKSFWDIQETVHAREMKEANTKIKNLEEEVAQSKGTICEIYGAQDVNKAIWIKTETELKSVKLGYDPMNPYFKEVPPRFKPEQYNCVYADIKTGTQNRVGMVELKIPKRDYTDGSFDFELPKGSMKIRKADLRTIDKPFEITSNISEKYAESVVWNDDKVARDLLQNFFDGHGQTLDGVRMKFIPIGEGKFKVRIEGKSIYDFKHAIIMGESTSHEISQAAGNYGEGLKMATLKLLKQQEGANVKIGSGNWEVVSSIRKDTRLDSDLMHYNINPVEFYDGNFIEFETANEGLLTSLRESINRFYHSSNKHFECPDFENDLFGFKLLPKGSKGGFYISGQRFEYDGDYDGFKDAVVFIKQKIPTNIYDMSRDRGTIDSYSWGHISEWLIDNTTVEESKQILKTLEPVMEIKQYSNLSTLGFDNLRKLNTQWPRVIVKFPDNNIAQPSSISDRKVEEELMEHGYKIFPHNYDNIGMKSMVNIVNKAQQHKPLQPTKIEEKKIIILRKALDRLKVLTKEHFTAEELDTHIHIFDAKSAVENSIRQHSHVGAEAIIDNDFHKVKGFWIDREYLNKSKFSDVFETALHELSHKAGGDGTEKFGYKLTDVNKDAIAEIIDNPSIAQEFRALSEIWAKL